MGNEIKKNRIKEFDYAKAIATVIMVFVHTEFAIYNYENAFFGTLIDYLGSPFGAPIFMFVLGANVYMSSKNSPKELFCRGVKLFSISLVFNVVCHALPFFILDYVNESTNYSENALHWVFAVDILTFAGLAFMFFALVRKLKLSNKVLLIIAFVFSGINILLSYYCSVDFNEHVILAAVTSLFYNSSITGYFSFMSWIAFPIVGYVFVQKLETLDEKNKEKFYLRNGIVCLAIYLFMIFLSAKFFKHLPFVVYTEEYAFYRMHPYNAIGTLFFCMAWLPIIYFISKKTPKFLDNIVNRFNKNLTSIYLIQWFIINYCFVLAFNGTLYVNEWQYVLISLTILIVTDILAVLNSKYIKWKNNK